MSGPQQEMFREMVDKQENLTNLGIDYWMKYSHFGTWQFWVNLLLLLVPILIVYLKIDRKDIFRIGFFGFTVHVLFAYIDSSGIRLGLWGYPYQVIPFLPSFSLDAAIIPVTIMLIYQWTIRNGKNFYFVSIIAALVFGFGFKPLLVMIGLFEKYKWINYFYIYLIYQLLFLVGYWLTKIFLRLHLKSKES
ncbi:CBO0543 family protein [Bacillus suaedaesalsae]|uniref:Integral membrane protein n=1 Tax=Bacillus suaedaesalsae TaxID=2810349 RepID=A0ABS2DJN8_9BACI|nr:CBO0543 family protein [Bacillus suaedaesalsae]MBM6618711.1 hypothetical protein [Bacillus suaedaesalsae]